MNIEQQFPSIAAFERGARKRIPKFAAEYLFGGIGNEHCLQKNREVMNAIKLRSTHICDVDVPDFGTTLWGQKYDAPFGIAPLGLGGLVWPRAAEHMAAAAKSQNIPFTLSTFATTDLETARKMGGDNTWFQLYPTVDPTVESDIIDRCERAGYDVLVVTIDIPTVTRRERDIANGLAVPPQFNLKTVAQIAMRPRWAMQTLIDGIPRFDTLSRYIPKGFSIQQEAQFLTDLIEGHVTREKLKRFRQRWKGKLIVKGVLDVEDARFCSEIGVDGIVVSNHGGRQLDASPHPLHVLPEIRAAVGNTMPLLVDGGIRSGLDIARTIACGADFVLLGRALISATAAASRPGCDHAITLLKEELRHTMVQIGCQSLVDLPGHVIDGTDKLTAIQR